MTEDNRHSVSVAAVVTNDDGRVLVIQRRDNGEWQIPGGVLEREESIHTGVRREVNEETGLDIDPHRLTGVYKNLRLGVIALVFRATVIGGTACPTEESAAIDWWTPDEVTARMGETFAVRVMDALNMADVAIRLHDGLNVIPEQA
jgi:8-oxo-dGTP pyrophosphatase MutT (NUDIX family)